MSLRHHSRMAHKAIPQQHRSNLAVARCNNATLKQLIRFGSNVAATSQSLDVNGPLLPGCKICQETDLFSSCRMQVFLGLSRAGVAEWSTAPCLLCATQMVMGLSPKPPPMLADMFADMWIEKAQLPCWPLYSQQVSHQRWISGIHCRQVTKHTSKGSTLALKPRGDVTRSPKRVSVAPRKGLVSKKLF